MKTQAAVLVEIGRPLEIAELEIPALQPGQILVEVAVSGVCRTQLNEARGFKGPDPYLPHCLGHEGTGRVLEVGAGVNKVKPGDSVILSWIQGSGAQVPGSQYRWNGRTVNAGGVTTFGRHAVVSENRLTVIPADFPMKEGALIGCAVPTGMGAVVNVARPEPDQSIAVFGTGGVGLCAVAGAALSGCAPIVAVDVQDRKLALARAMGATHTVNAAQADPIEEIKTLCPHGLDFAVEASGRTEVMEKMLAAVRPRGGTVVVVGNAPRGERFNLDPYELNLGKRLLGTWGGDTQPDRDFPRHIERCRSGELDLAPLLSAPYRLEEINTVLDDLEAGRAIRPLIDMTL